MDLGPDIPEIELPDPRRLRDRLARVTAVLIVVGTLTGAIVGLLLADAAKENEEADEEAQMHSIEATGALLRSKLWAQTEYELFTLGEQRREDATNAWVRSFFAPDPKELRMEFNRLKMVADRMQELADAIAEAKLTDVKIQGEYAPGADPTFPSRFFAAAATEATRHQALEDASNEEAGAWRGRIASCAAVITILAVALYLLGFSYTQASGARRWLAGTGGALVAIGIASAMVLYVTPPQAVPEEAAMHYAEGHTLLLTADSVADKSRYEMAIEHLSRAIELRPTFARAYQDRAGATFRAHSPQTSGYQSLTTRAALESGIADLRKAQELGLVSVESLGNLGFYYFELGLLEHSDSLIDQGLPFTERAIDAARDAHLENEIVLQGFNRAVALLAEGRPQAADDAYRGTLKMALDSSVLDEYLVAGAITDLELVTRHRPALAEDAQGMKALIVGSASLGEVGVAETAATMSGLTADVYAADMQVRWDSLRNRDRDTDRVSVLWFYNDFDDHGWSAIPEVSGVIRTEDRFAYGGKSDEGFLLRSFLPHSVPPRCLASGQYRVEVYVNGNLVGAAEEGVTDRDLQPVIAKALNVVFCVPSDWHLSDETQPGVLTGFVSPDERRGAYVFRFTLPAIRHETPSKQASQRWLMSVISEYAYLFPDQPNPGREIGREYVLGLDGETWRASNYAGGRLLAGAGVARNEGTIVVFALFGPPAYAHDSVTEWWDVRDSLVQYQDFRR